MIADLLTRECTLLLSDGTDTINDDGQEETTVTTVDTVCELQQRGRAEPGGEGELSDTTWLLVLPATAPDVRSDDRVLVDGLVYEMVGDPWRARNPVSGVVSHVECSVRRTAGDDNAS